MGHFPQRLIRGPVRTPFRPAPAWSEGKGAISAHFLPHQDLAVLQVSWTMVPIICSQGG